MFDPFILFALSFVMGFFGALLGIGGGTFLIPTLVIFLDMPMVQAVPLALFCALGAGLSSVLLAQPREKELVSAFIFEPTAMVGALLCAPLVHLVPNSYLLLLFSMFIFLSAFLGLRQEKVGYEPNNQWQTNLRGGVASLITGGCSGLFGVGGGIILIPLLQGFARIELKRAIPISLFLMVSTSCVALMVHALSGAINLTWGILCVLGAVPGGMLASDFREKLSTKNLKIIFFMCAIVISLSLVVKNLGV